MRKSTFWSGLTLLATLCICFQNCGGSKLLSAPGEKTATSASLNSDFLPEAAGGTLAITVSPVGTVFAANSHLTLSASGGTPPYTFQVNGRAVAAGAFRTPASAANLTVTVQDAAGRRGTKALKSTSQVVATSGYYNGGDIMLGEAHLYTIWYGDWSYSPSSKPIINAYETGLGGSDYYGVVTSYFGANGAYASNAIKNSKQTAIAQSAYGQQITNDDLKSMITSKINDGTFPADENGVYAVLLSKGVDLMHSGKLFCSSKDALSGGYHAYFTLPGGQRIKYLMAADITGRFCATQLNNSESPNNNPGADFMASVLGHEITETITNPYDIRGLGIPLGWDKSQDGLGEIGDLCAHYNGVPKGEVQLGGRTFFVQKLMRVSGADTGKCVMSINEP